MLPQNYLNCGLISDFCLSTKKPAVLACICGCFIAELSIALELEYNEDHIGITKTLQILTPEDLPSSKLSKALYVIVDMRELRIILLSH